MNWSKGFVKALVSVGVVFVTVLITYVTAAGAGNEKLVDIMNRTVWTWWGMADLTLIGALRLFLDFLKHR